VINTLGVLPHSIGASSEVVSQILRFWSFHDRSVQTATAGVLLLSIACGVLGCFVVLRRLSLMGDSLGHAVLPGVCLGFLVTWTKDPRYLVAGAVLAAFCASWLVGFITRNSRLKPDVAMGLVLSGFFAVGVALLTRLQNFQAGSQSGLNQFLFGQASAISERDLRLTAGLAIAIVGCTGAFFKELAITSFDEGFATSIGLPVRPLHYLLMGLVALAIVVSIQAVGVVLLSAMLITPAATALLLTDRLTVMVALSVTVACVSGVVGLNLSFLSRNLPTGPFIVVVLAAVFVAAWCVSPRYGILTRAWRRALRARRTRHENLLKSLYLAASESGGESPVLLSDLAARQRESHSQTARMLRGLVRRGWAVFDGRQAALTEDGRGRARELVRNYELWEQFLAEEIHLPPDHTDRGAHEIEHLLDPGLVRALEERAHPPEAHGAPAGATSRDRPTPRSTRPGDAT
jgi:manganese/zinc/iron transport system permease protein